MNYMAAVFAGRKVITSPWLTEPGEPVTVRRTWRERFLTRPWRPWRSVRIVVPQVPSKRAVELPDGTLVVHPAMLQRLRELCEPSRVSPEEPQP